MKRLGGLARLTPLLLAGCVGGAATAWSPVSCSCTDAWESVLAGLGVRGDEIRGPEQLTQQFIADRIRQKFSGKTIRADDLPYATSTSNCVDGSIPAQAVRCRWWIWESGDMRKGFDVLVRTDGQGYFRSVVVTPVASHE